MEIASSVISKFSGLPRSEVAGKLNKTCEGNRKGFKTEVLVSREKHFVLAYNRKRKQVTLTCNYACWNETIFKCFDTIKL